MPAEFSARPPSRSEEAPLVVFVATPNGNGINSVDVRVGLADGRVLEGYTQDYGWRLTAEDRPGVVQWIELSLTPYGVPPRRFTVDGNAGNQFNFTFTPNDFGVLDMTDMIVDADKDGLTLHCNGGTMLFEKDEENIVDTIPVPAKEAEGPLEH